MAERKGANNTCIRIDECERRARELDVLDYEKAQADKVIWNFAEVSGRPSRLDGGRHC